MNLWEMRTALQRDGVSLAGAALGASQPAGIAAGLKTAQQLGCPLFATPALELWELTAVKKHPHLLLLPR